MMLSELYIVHSTARSIEWNGVSNDEKARILKDVVIVYIQGTILAFHWERKYHNKNTKKRTTNNAANSNMAQDFKHECLVGLPLYRSTNIPVYLAVNVCHIFQILISVRKAMKFCLGEHLVKVFQKDVIFYQNRQLAIHFTAFHNNCCFHNQKCK